MVGRRAICLMVCIGCNSVRPNLAIMTPTPPMESPCCNRQRMPSPSFMQGCVACCKVILSSSSSSPWSLTY
ncbi:hypothetical protein F5880DRAFT_1539692 [Lentinula raphanica]|nr:hypothetical protein F5880DRAFT_1539692 [Lentinula raphanica]